MRQLTWNVREELYHSWRASKIFIHKSASDLCLPTALWMLAHNCCISLSGSSTSRFGLSIFATSLRACENLCCVHRVNLGGGGVPKYSITVLFSKSGEICDHDVNYQQPFITQSQQALIYVARLLLFSPVFVIGAMWVEFAVISSSSSSSSSSFTVMTLLADLLFADLAGCLEEAVLLPLW